MKCLILFVAFVAAAQAVPLPYGRHNIFINDDFWRVESPFGYSVAYHKPAVWTGVKNFEFVLNVPHAAPRTVFVTEKFGPEQSEVLFKILREYQGFVEPAAYEALLEKINHHVTNGFLNKIIYDLFWDLTKENFYQKYFHSYYPEGKHYGVYSPFFEKMGFKSYPYNPLFQYEHSTPYTYEKYPFGFEHQGQYPMRYQYHGQEPYYHQESFYHHEPTTGYGYEHAYPYGHHYSTEYPAHYPMTHEYGHGYYPSYYNVPRVY